MKKIITICLMLCFLACQNEDELLKPVKETKIVEDPLVTAGRLAFRSREHLASFVDNSKTIDLEDFKAKIASFETGAFRSLLPTFDSNNEARLAEFRQVKSRQLNGRIATEVDADDDELVADPNFALVLNQDREVIVDGIVYRITPYGVFYTDVESAGEIEGYVKAVSDCQLTLNNGGMVQRVGPDVDVYVPAPVSDLCDYEFETDDEPYYPEAVAAGSTKEQYMAQMKTCDYKENVFDKIFGPSEKCIAKFSDDRRIKTRAWNQNFLLYSSIGIRTKTQKRTMWIWWASDSDEIELGYEVTKFRFDGIDVGPVLSQIRQQSGIGGLVYYYNGYLLNQYGIIAQNNNWGKADNLFNGWPIKDEDSRVLKIFLGDNIENFLKNIDADLNTSIDGKQFNSAANALAKAGWDAVKRYLKTESSKGAVIMGGSPDKQRFYFVYTNWKNNNRNDNRISNVFDFNTGQIKFTMNPTSGQSVNWNNFDVSANARSYKEFAISCYGVARRGSAWKGRRIVLVQKK